MIGSADPADHAQHVQELARMIDLHQQQSRPLREHQQPMRRAEQDVRRRAVEMVRAARSQADVARALDVIPQTLCNWVRHDHASVACKRSLAGRGRPPLPIDPLVRIRVTELLESHGQSIGIPALKGLFRDVPRSALRDLRDQWCEEHETEPNRLLWTTPGVVWSADFTHPDMNIDACFGRVLLIRDLASHCLLLAQPCDAENADAVVAGLGQLFIRYDPPLVLKTDNGSPFIADCTRSELAHAGVTNLFSPPLTPQYNGSVEATGGCLKARTAQIARVNGRAECWSSDDIEAARLAANALNRPWGSWGPTPDERWRARVAITHDQRASLAIRIAEQTQTITRSMTRERQAKGLATELTAACRATVARTAIRQVLVELGYLHIRRPSIMSTEINADSSKN